MAHKAFAVVHGDTFETSQLTKSTSSPLLTFAFTGQGAQWPTMGKNLMETFPTFRADIQNMDRAVQRLEHRPSWQIESELLKPVKSSHIHMAEMSQPLCTAVQVALVNLLQIWGVSPSAVVGHSSGEIAAAYTAGAFTMETAICIAFYRGFVAKAVKQKGAMAAIGFGRSIVNPYLASGVVLACENSGGSVTISGDEDAVEDTIAKILQDHPDALARKLKVEVAYHSHHMVDVGSTYEILIRDEFQGAGNDLRMSFYSSVTGKTYMSSTDVGPSYWRMNLESPVLFYTAVKNALVASGETSVMLEVGPHSALQGPLKQVFKEVAPSAVYASSLIRNFDDTVSLLKAVGHLHCNGVRVDFGSLNEGGVTLSNLPTYAWNNENIDWREPRLARGYRFRKYPHHDLLGSRILESTDIEPAWRSTLDVSVSPWLREHALH
jgi:acyl transferase domain-containing protein